MPPRSPSFWSAAWLRRFLPQSIRAARTPAIATSPVNVSGISPNGSVVFGISLPISPGLPGRASAACTWAGIVSPFHVGTLVGSTTDGSVLVGTDYHTTLSDSHAAHWGDNLFDEFIPVPTHSRCCSLLLPTAL